MDLEFSLQCKFYILLLSMLSLHFFLRKLNLNFKMEAQKQISPLKNFFSGGFGGVCLVAAGHPLDTVKVRVQTMAVPTIGQMPQYTGTVDCVVKTFQQEGLKGFYKGMATPLVGVIPMCSITFFGYSLGKKIQTSKHDGHHSSLQIFNAGMLAGLGTTVLVAPGERIKCLLQIQADNSVHKYSGPLDCATKLYHTGGIRSLYRGLLATLLRDVPATGVYFMTYEWIQRKLRPANSSPGELGVAQTLFAGGAAGMMFWVVGIPPDVLKTRLQTSPDGTYPNGIRDVFKSVIQQEGLKGMYKGASAVFLRAFPANAACFFGYEVAMKLLHVIAPDL